VDSALSVETAELDGACLGEHRRLVAVVGRNLDRPVFTLDHRQRALKSLALDSLKMPDKFKKKKNRLFYI